jgi:CBS domain-containing protein
VVREDLAPRARGEDPVLPFAKLTDRTVASSESAAIACRTLLERGQRRLAVVDEHKLVGLLCLKRRRTGFCTDADVASRAEAQ